MLQSKSMNHCEFIVSGRADAMVYMHWIDYTIPTKDGAQLERLFVCAQSELAGKTKIFNIMKLQKHIRIGLCTLES